MATTIVKWGEFAFKLGGTSMMGIEDIEIAASCETEDKETDDEKYAEKKNAKPYEVELKAILDAKLGIDVKKTAMKMTEAARKGQGGYLYTAGAKLMPCKFMAVGADVSEIEMNAQGKWLFCEVKLKLTQCSKYNGKASSSGSSGSGGSSSKSSSSGSSNKVSVKTSSTTTTRLPMTGVSAKSTAAVAAAHAAGTTGSAKATSAAIKSKASSSSGKISVIKNGKISMMN